MNNTISEAEKILTDPDFFQTAVNFAARRTGFAARLIEKDYFCSVLLGYLASASKDLVFKGGTCLAKVYAGFYRMSEDLDFVISMSTNAKQTDRSKQARALKHALADMPAQLPAFRMLVLQLVRSEFQGRDEEMRLSAYRTEAGAEVDFILERKSRLFAVEVKAKRKISVGDLRALKSFAAFYGRPHVPLVIYMGEQPARLEGVEVLPVEMVMAMLPAA